MSRNSRQAIYQHKHGLTCGVAFVVVRHLLVVALCFAGFPRDGEAVGRQPSHVMEFQDRAPPSALTAIALKLQQKPKSLLHGPQHLDDGRIEAA